MLALVSISWMTIAAVHGNPPPPNIGSNGIAPKAGLDPLGVRSAETGGSRNRTVIIVDRTDLITDSIGRCNYLCHESPDLIEDHRHRRRVDISKGRNAQQPRQINDLIQDKMNVGKGWQIVVHRSILPEGS